MGSLLSGIMGTDSGSNGMQVSQATNELNPYQQQQTQNYQQQQALAAQLQAQANGTGPNPAMAQLNQTTQANGQQAASTLASNRGMNSGLAARTAAQAQTGANQQAAGQAATMQAQQQIAAQGQLNSLYGTMNSGAAQQENALNGAAAINASLAQGNQQQSSSAAGGVMSGIGAAFGMARGGVVGQKMADGGLTVSPYQDYSGGVQGPQSFVGKNLSGGSGGDVKSGMTNLGQGINDASSGPSSPSTPASTMPSSDDWYQTMTAPTNGGNASSDQWASMMQNGPVTPTPMAQGGMAQTIQQLAPLAMMAMKSGGKVPTILSPGEGKLSPKQAMEVAKGKKDAIKTAKVVPGKAEVPGDSLKNDKVPTKMEAGSIVLPRSVMMAKNPHWAAHAFVSAHLGIPKGKKKS